MRDYELTVLLHPDLEIDLEKPLQKVEQIITTNGGKIVKQDNWGKRKLAYRINKEDFAVYVYYDVQLPAEAVKKINDVLNITDEVLRFLLAAHDERADKAAAAAEAAKEARAEATEEAKE